MELLPGATAEVERTVAESDTAIALGSGDVPVLGTPKVLALAEAATVAALAGRLAGTDTTVGTSVALRHLAPTPVGGRVRARATLTEVEAGRLVFTVAVYEGDRTVAEGIVERALLDRDRFLKKALGR